MNEVILNIRHKMSVKDFVGDVIFNNFEEEDIPDLVINILKEFDITSSGNHDLLEELEEKIKQLSEIGETL